MEALSMKIQLSLYSNSLSTFTSITPMLAMLWVYANKSKALLRRTKKSALKYAATHRRLWYHNFWHKYRRSKGSSSLIIREASYQILGSKVKVLSLALKAVNCSRERGKKVKLISKSKGTISLVFWKNYMGH